MQTLYASEIEGVEKVLASRNNYYILNYSYFYVYIDSQNMSLYINILATLYVLYIAWFSHGHFRTTQNVL